MSIQKFPLATVNKIRQYIQTALVLTEAEQHQMWVELEETEDPPAPESLDDLSGIFAFGGLSVDELSQPGQWSISTVNPAAALIKLPGLRLQSEFRWVSYLYRQTQAGQPEGKGLVFAIPEQLSATACLEKALATRDLAHPPSPQGALTHFMEALEGDRAPGSFLIASLLRRELEEFGALGQHRSWSHHRLIEAVPPQAKWRWQGNPPQDLSPKVKLLPNGQAATEFFTCRIQAPVALYRHLEQYTATHYKAHSLDKAIATAYR